MHCDDAVIEYDNGDVYKGGVIQAKKSDKHATYQYYSGDRYEGPFLNDVKQTDINN